MNNLFNLIPIAYAANVDVLVRRINKFVLNPLIFFLFAAALAYFLYGLVEFISNAGNEDALNKGKQHMLWGIIGMFIMMSVFGIMQLIINTLGIKGIDVGTGEVNLQ